VEEFKEEIVADEVVGEVAPTPEPEPVQPQEEVAPVVVEKPAKPAKGSAEVLYKRGDMGLDVLKAQEALNSSGLYCVIDGTFDASTEAAIMNFQGNKGLEMTGKIDTITWQALVK
jgi:peptidoglycan hydrolase-like protein with peptidoglycan-binding domain